VALKAVFSFQAMIV